MGQGKANPPGPRPQKATVGCAGDAVAAVEASDGERTADRERKISQGTDVGRVPLLPARTGERQIVRSCLDALSTVRSIGCDR